MSKSSTAGVVDISAVHCDASGSPIKQPRVVSSGNTSDSLVLASLSTAGAKAPASAAAAATGKTLDNAADQDQESHHVDVPASSQHDSATVSEADAAVLGDLQIISATDPPQVAAGKASKALDSIGNTLNRILNKGSSAQAKKELEKKAAENAKKLNVDAAIAKTNASFAGSTTGGTSSGGAGSSVAATSAAGDFVADYKEQKSKDEKLSAKERRRREFEDSVKDLCGPHGNLWHFAHVAGVIPPENLLSLVTKIDEWEASGAEDGDDAGGGKGEPVPGGTGTVESTREPAEVVEKTTGTKSSKEKDQDATAPADSRARECAYPVPTTSEPEVGQERAEGAQHEIHWTVAHLSKKLKDEPRCPLLFILNGKVLQQKANLPPSLTHLLRDEIHGKDITVEAGRNRCHFKYGMPSSVDSMSVEFKLYLEKTFFQSHIGSAFGCVARLIQESVV